LTLGVKGVPDSTATPSDPATQRLITLQIVMSAVIGGFFGIAVYMIFVSELFDGELFPSFKSLSPGASGSAMAQLIHDTALASPKDAAKAVAWSFVAGFSEQFVPNLLDKLAKTAEDKVP
jgi:hypothetical protein